MLATARILRSNQMLRGIGSVRAAWEKLDAEVKLHHYKIRNFEPNIRMSFERGPFVVKTVQTGAELEECLKLRFDVFHKEYMNKKRKSGVDIDRLDYVCDHLAIFDKRVGKFIGTYRLNCSLFTDTFYSAGEFNMGKVLELPGTKLELGRACIDKEHRNGTVIALLWRGIMEYVERTDAKVLFGCASIKTMEPLEIGLITKYLNDKGYMAYEYGVTTTKKYKVKQLARVLEYIEHNSFEYYEQDVEKLIPTLFQSYLRAGAKAVGEPALDREFNCIDFLTVLKLDEMSAQFKGKYKK